MIYIYTDGRSTAIVILYTTIHTGGCDDHIIINITNKCVRSWERDKNSRGGIPMKTFCV